MEGDGDGLIKLDSMGPGEHEQEGDREVRRARAFEAAQHAQTLKEAIWGNRKALGWCSYSLFTCIMWGYDGLASSVCFSLSLSPFWLLRAWDLGLMRG